MRVYFTLPNKEVEERPNIDAVDIIHSLFTARIRESGILVLGKNNEQIFELKIVGNNLEIERRD